MSKAIETVMTGFTPSPLQVAAIRRIQELQQELAQHGMYMRSAMELEFTVEDRNGILKPYTLNLKATEKFISNPAFGLKHFEKLKTDASSDYEITLADRVTPDKKVDPTRFSPLLIAAETASLKRKNGALHAALMNSTCLNPEVDVDMRHTPVFNAYPYSLAHKDSSWQYEDRSSALHINVSLYDKKGNNLFTKHPALMEHCAHDLVEVQKHAALSMLPKKNSLRRLNRDAHISVPGGFGMELSPDSGRRAFSSVNIRGGIYEVGGPGAKTRFKHDTRIENRLPGADADPFVAMAVTMAAVVETVRKDVKDKPVPLAPRYHFPESREEMINDMLHSHNMRTILGDELYRAVLLSQKELHGHPLAI